MKVSLIRVTDDPQRLIEMAAAVCQNADPYARLNSRGMDAIDSGHLSVAEHTVFTFLIEGVSRVTMAQLTRHRIASFSVQSQRTVNMQQMRYIIPPSIQNDPMILAEYKALMEHVQDFYTKAVGRNIPKEDARYATTQAATTNILMTMNAAELLHFLSLRECDRAQWEIRELARRIREICIHYLPDLFKHSGAPCRRGKCPEKRPCKLGPKPLRKTEESRSVDK